MKILVFTHPQVDPNLYDFLPSVDTKYILKKSDICPYNEGQWDLKEKQARKESQHEFE